MLDLTVSFDKEDIYPPTLYSRYYTKDRIETLYMYI